VIAPSLIPKRPGVQRKHDRRDASELARLYRAGELTPVRIPSEAEERVRDVVRCRETFQREILKSRHYILKFLARRGLVFREGTNWCTPRLRWRQHLTVDRRHMRSRINGEPHRFTDPSGRARNVTNMEDRQFVPPFIPGVIACDRTHDGRMTPLGYIAAMETDARELTAMETRTCRICAEALDRIRR